jgi:uncharacterized protein YgbK (DUF1537 family)
VSTPPAARAAPFLGLVADDLTGAIDSAVQFAAAGWDARLVRRLEAIDVPDLNAARPRLEAVTTGIRASSDDGAAASTRAAAAALAAAGVDRLFVKIDSTVRGSVAGQVRGALAAWRQRHPDAVAIICPAFPDHGRTVVAGTVRVHGKPVALTAAGQDPVTPVTTSSVQALFPGTRSVASVEVIDSATSESLVVDAVTGADLARIAATLGRLGPRAVAVGSAGLAQAIAGFGSVARPFPRTRRPVDRVLVAISSRHPAAHRQLARLLETLAGADSTGPPSPVQSPVVVISTPKEVSPHEHPVDVAATLARRVATELQRQPYDALVLIGGDGAHAVLDELGADQVEIVDDLAPGTPYGTLLGGAGHGLQVVTRSGGFGDVDSLVRIVDQLLSPPDPSTDLARSSIVDTAHRRN